MQLIMMAMRAGAPEPNYNSFPVFSADCHTWFGKGLKEGLKSLNRIEDCIPIISYK